MQRKIQLEHLKSSKQLLLSLQELIQINHLRYQNDQQFDSIYSRLRKSQKQKRQEYEISIKKSKIKKYKKTLKKKTQKEEKIEEKLAENLTQNQFKLQKHSHISNQLEVEQSSVIFDYMKQQYNGKQDIMLPSYFSITKNQLKYSNQLKQIQNQMLDDFVTDLVQQICYQNDRRKSLLQMQGKSFIRILIQIQHEFQKFISSVNELEMVKNMNFRQKKINQSFLESQFVQQIMLNIPEIKDVLSNFEQKYSSNQQYKTQYQQLLKKKKIIYSVKNIIDRQNQSEDDDDDNNANFYPSQLSGQSYFSSIRQRNHSYGGIVPFQLASQKEEWYQTQQIYSILKKNNVRYNEKQYFSYDWQDMKTRLNSFSLKIEEQMNQKQKNKKKRKCKKKKKKRDQNILKNNIIQEQDKQITKISQFLQNLEIDTSKTFSCRLDEDWLNSFRNRNLKDRNMHEKDGFNFKKINN